jgi:LysM repeat protein
MSKIRLFHLSIFLLIYAQGFAQKLMVHGASPKLYLSHKVAPKENWYSIGRLYNISPKEIAPFNKSSLNKPLSVGQELRIPLGESNFSQDGLKSADEVFLPVYHVVGEKEWMFRISNNHNKVPVANIEKWNSISNDELKPGLELIVGWLKVKKGQSALASKGLSKISIAAKTPVSTDKKEDVVRRDPLPQDKVISVNPDKDELPNPITKTVSEKSSISYKGGYFRRLYLDGGKSSTGNAGIIRSTSGWEDGKYYALMNNVPVGTIVKVTFPSTNKSVYAKVLGQLPEMKESNGLSLRISDAAASELGVAINKFYVDVKY